MLQTEPGLALIRIKVDIGQSDRPTLRGFHPAKPGG